MSRRDAGPFRRSRAAASSGAPGRSPPRRRTGRSGSRAGGRAASRRAGPAPPRAPPRDGIAPDAPRRLDRDVLELVRDGVGAVGEPVEQLGIVVRADEQLADVAGRRVRRGIEEAEREPERDPASASIRPSWPPPMTPTITQYVVGSAREHGLGLRLAVAGEALAHARVGARHDRGREQRRVDRSRAADRERARPAPRPASARSRAASPSPSASSTRPGRRAPAAPSSRRPCPGRCAAPPAPAISTWRPRASAEPAYSKRRSGVRCADTTCCSNGTSSASSVSHAWRIVSQSEREPMITPTSAVTSLSTSSSVRRRPSSRSCAAPAPARRRRPARSGSGSSRAAAEPFFRQTIASRRTARFGSFVASSCSIARMLFTSPGWSRERPSSAISAEPRAAGLSSWSPRRTSSSFWRNRNCAIAR